MANSSISSQTVSYPLTNGLATYSVGEGQTVLLMPYPHGFSASPIAEGVLAQALVDAGCRVITFDYCTLQGHALGHEANRA